MTSGPHTHPTTPPADPAAVHVADLARHALRLRLKPKAAPNAGPIAEPNAEPTGYVDGGWWPRSWDLAAEVPALAEVLTVRLGSVARVAFALSAWDAVPRRIAVDGHVIRLEGFHSQDPHVVHVSGPDRRRISLLVVPPDTAEAKAHDALMVASHRNNADRPADILAVDALAAGGDRPTAPVPEPRATPDAAGERWGIDGGRVYERG